VRPRTRRHRLPGRAHRPTTHRRPHSSSSRNFPPQNFAQQGFPQDPHGPQQGFPPQAPQQDTQYLAQGPADPYAQHHPGQPWQSTANDDKPLWDPDGPMPQTNSHRQPAPAGKSGRNRGLLIGVAVLLVAAVGAVAFVFLSKGDDAKPVASKTSQPVTQPGDKTPVKSSPQAVAQAKKVNSLLNASARSRKVLGVALAQAGACAKLPQAIPTMEKVVVQRQQQLAVAQGLQIPALGANAVPLRTSLTNAIKFSLDADVSLLNWAKAHQGCKGKTPSDPNFVNASKLSNSATGAKNKFKGIWNKIAPALGFQKRAQF
jgi:flagellar basal body-associated protein FliL